MVEYIKSLFEDQGIIGIIAQCIGFIALFVSAISFQQKTQKMIVIIQCFSTTLWMIHMFLLGAWAGGFLNLIGLARAVVYTFRQNHSWAHHPAWYCVFISAFAVSSAYSAWCGDGLLALLPFAGMVFSTFSFASSKPSSVRLLFLCGSPCWLVYDVFKLSVAGIVAEIFNMTSILSGMLRLDLPAYRQKQREQKEAQILKKEDTSGNQKP